MLEVSLNFETHFCSNTTGLVSSIEVSINIYLSIEAHSKNNFAQVLCNRNFIEWNCQFCKTVLGFNKSQCYFFFKTTWPFFPSMCHTTIFCKQLCAYQVFRFLPGKCILPSLNCQKISIGLIRLEIQSQLLSKLRGQFVSSDFQMTSFHLF